MSRLPIWDGASPRAIEHATAEAEFYMHSEHVIMVPWCQCCDCPVQVYHVCECEQDSTSNRGAKP